ncbi:MAG TPA: efflux RND transporter periplasmic adaptor subunit [Gammaproteobacteria bacterium]
MLDTKQNLNQKLKETRITKRFGYLPIGIIVAIVIIGAIVGIKALQFGAMFDAGAQMVMPPEPVNVAEVREREWQPRISSVGTVAAVQGIVVTTEVEGIVRTIRFEAGSVVKAGTELVQLDVDVEQAQLRSAQAAAEGAQLTYNRAKELIKTHAISQSDYNTANVAYKQANAQVDNFKAIIAKKTLRAPFDGKLGIRQISVGQFLNKGEPVVSLQSLDPVYVDFSLPQQRLGEISEGLKVAVTSDAYPGQPFEGAITAVNPDIDPATRNVRVQATLANADGRLRPGMFVAIDMILEKSDKVLFIPETAVLHAPFGDSVFVVEEGPAGEDGTRPLVVQQQFVRLGVRQGDFVAATEGLKAGQKIVATGVFKLRPGMAVVIDTKLAPKFTFEPKPDNT